MVEQTPSFHTFPAMKQRGKCLPVAFWSCQSNKNANFDTVFGWVCGGVNVGSSYTMNIFKLTIISAIKERLTIAILYPF